MSGTSHVDLFPDQEHFGFVTSQLISGKLKPYFISSHTSAAKQTLLVGYKEEPELVQCTITAYVEPARNLL